MENAIIVVAIIAFFAFQQWMRHQRRVLAHRERLAAIEKGIELPIVEQEAKRSTFNVQRMLLFSGMIWIVLGASAYLVLTSILSYPRTDVTKDIPAGIQYVGFGGIGIGLAHLITYAAGARRDK
jgi:hypothetical protein